MFGGNNLCSNQLKVLADKTRLKVVRLLFKGPMTVGELEVELNVEQSLLSHHLSILRKADIVMFSRKKKNRLYELSTRVSKGADIQSLNLGCCEISF